jgi:hypothetical protein
LGPEARLANHGAVAVGKMRGPHGDEETLWGVFGEIGRRSMKWLTRRDILRESDSEFERMSSGRVRSIEYTPHNDDNGVPVMIKGRDVYAP